LTYAKRNRTSAKDIGYALYLYFLGLSYRNTSKALSRFIRRSHVSVWKWVQHYKPERISFKRRKISKFIIDETQIKVGQDYFWIWVAIEPIDKVILGTYISLERNMLIAEEFLCILYDKQIRKTSSLNRWWNMVSSSLQILENKTSFTFII
jgi:putative transposase